MIDVYHLLSEVEGLIVWQKSNKHLQMSVSYENVENIQY